MSIRLQSRVWESVPLDGTGLLLLLAIADHANDEGVCWPRVERLAKLVRRSVRQTQRLLRLLEAGGYIITTPGSGRGRVTVIRLNLHALPLADSGDDVMMDALDFAIDKEGDASDFAIHPNGDAPDSAIQAEKGVTRVTLCALKGDTHDTLSLVKGDTPDTLSPSKGDTHDTPSPAKGDTNDTHSAQKGDSRDTLSPDEKVTSRTQKVTSSAEKVTSSAQKGDIAPHASVDPSKNHQLNHQETRASLPATLFVDEGNNAGDLQPKSESTSSGKSAGKPPSKSAGKSAKRARSGLADAVSKVISEIEDQRAEKRAETPQQSFFRVVAWVLGWEVKSLSEEQRGAVAQTIGYLTKSGYTENDVRRFWSEIWLNDWRWKRNREHPRPSQLRSEIFRLRAASTLAQEAAPHPDKPALSADEEELVALLKEASKRERLDPSSPIRERLDLSYLQRHGLGLPNG